MKTLLVTTLLLGAATAGADTVTIDSSWESILNTRSVEVDMPIVRMTHGPVTTIDQLCIEGDILRTKNMFTRHIAVDRSFGGPDDDRRVRYRYEKFFGYAEFVQTYTVCHRERRDRIGSDFDPRCDFETQESYTVPTHYTGEEAIPVYKIRNLDRDNERRSVKLFTKEYTIPVCE